MNEQTEELSSLYVMDLLDSAELSAFEAQLAGDEALRAHVDSLRETAAQLAHAAPLRQPPAYLEARIMDAIRAEKVTTMPTPRASLHWLPWALAACLAIACVVLVTDRADTRKELARLRTRNATAEMQIATLSSQLATAPNASAVVLWDAEKQEGVLKVTNVPATAANRDYQLWIVDPQYGQPVDAGVFNVAAGEATAKIPFKPKSPVSSATAFAVSLEKKGGVPKAEGQMVLAGK